MAASFNIVFGSRDVAATHVIENGSVEAPPYPSRCFLRNEHGVRKLRDSHQYHVHRFKGLVMVPLVSPWDDSARPCEVKGHAHH